MAIIAGSHHERLNGTGYPNRLRAEEIPLQSKMMSISDIFDALTASDRPYKRAVPVEKALEILGFEGEGQPRGRRARAHLHRSESLGASHGRTHALSGSPEVEALESPRRASRSRKFPCMRDYDGFEAGTPLAA